MPPPQAAQQLVVAAQRRVHSPFSISSALHLKSAARDKEALIFFSCQLT